MFADVDRVLISQEQIAARIRTLAQEVLRDYQREAAGGEIAIVPIMTGAMIFCADLIRQMPIAMRIGLVTITSYPGTSTSSQGARLLDQKLADVRGRWVVVLDDVLDSGGTLRLIVPHLLQLGAKSVKTCVLLRKDRPAAKATGVDYVGFDIPDEFIVGYGLDYNDEYRNLPDVVTLKAAAIERGRKTSGDQRAATVSPAASGSITVAGGAKGA